MRKMYVYGASELGQEVVDKLEARQITAEGYLDTYKENYYNNLKIIELSDVNAGDIVIIAVNSHKSVTSIYNYLQAKEDIRIYWYFAKNGMLSNTGDFLIDECVEITNWGKCVLSYLDFHVSDKCNLNCKCCDHFSPLFSEIGASYEERITDLVRIRELFSSVAKITILGGEPLLCQELELYIAEIRRLFPDTVIVLLTNGLLVHTLPDSIFNLIHENRIVFEISEYSPTHRLMPEIVSRLEKHDICYNIRPLEDKSQFKKPFSIKKDTKYKQKCLSNGCYIVANGKMACCASLMYIDKFNDYFNLNLPNEGIIDLSEDISGEDLLKRLQNKVPLCDYCIDCFVKWQQCGKNIVVEDFAELE